MKDKWPRTKLVTEVHPALPVVAAASYRKNCGADALKLAEQDLLGEALEVCLFVLQNTLDPHIRAVIQPMMDKLPASYWEAKLPPKEGR